jgi:CheY-like chemotaxis protein
MHAGKVSATSAGPGKGTTFEITLPRTPGVQTTQGKPELAQSQPRRILVVDDNADSAHSLSLLLSFEGHETQTAYTAADALQLIESFQPDVVLLDIGLPKMDGYEVARCVRKLTRGNSIRLIAVTGYGQPNDRARTRDAGFDAHLVKPIDLAALERALLERAPDV